VHSSLLVLIVLAIGWMFFYWISLRLHPFTTCRTCGGTGRHRGLFAGNSSRACGNCGGSSRVLRLGVRMFLDESSMKYRR
jgi:hypothetical protein